MGFSKPTFIGPYDHIYNLEKKKKHFAAVYCKLYLFLVFSFFFACGTHSANSNEKVHKPQYWTLEVTRVKEAKHAEIQTY